jgi:hypothetical protein
MPFLISSIPLLKPLLKRDDATRDGFSAREESELTARIGSMLGFNNLNPADSSDQILRHMENQRDPRSSYQWIAQNHGLVNNNGRPIESELIQAFTNSARISSASNEKKVNEIPDLKMA